MPPFTVLHVCMGNICRSPMAERLLLHAVRTRLARSAAGPVPAAALEELLYSHSAGTGGWHAGDDMNPPAAQQLRARGADPTGFAARKLSAEHIEASDLVLTATADQAEYVVALRPDAAARTFVLGQFGRLLGSVDPAALPPAAPSPQAVYARGVALVAAADDARSGAAPLTSDDLEDPWGRGEQCFTEVADEIEETLYPFAAVLLP
ncbi:MAG TPA: phosphotyrosine protein phosphatase [Micromonosporaceae bacterium]|nr:phosphotyrosine protein phosphatase [Micromonosporaceae bacterium]